MSLKSLEATINGNREQAVKLREQLSAHVAAIRGNAAMSAEGKQLAIAHEYSVTAGKVAALGEGEKAALEKTAAELNRKVFGQYSTDTTSTLAFRDAQDRAERLESRGMRKRYSTVHRSATTPRWRLRFSRVLSRPAGLMW